MWIVAYKCGSSITVKIEADQISNRTRVLDCNGARYRKMAYNRKEVSLSVQIVLHLTSSAHFRILLNTVGWGRGWDLFNVIGLYELSPRATSFEGQHFSSTLTDSPFC